MTTLDQLIRHLGTERTFRKGTALFNAEDTVIGFYQILTGEVRVFKMDTDGNELEITRLTDGDFLGEAVTFTQDHYPLFAEAVKDTKTFFFDKKKVLAVIDQDPKIGRFFIQLLARKCLALNKRLETLGLKTIRQRLVQYILDLCPGHGNCILELQIKKSELAKQLGTVGETLSRNLRQLQDEGLIVVKGKKIQIKNCTALTEELYHT